MAVSKCVYPYPVLIIRDVREIKMRVPCVRDVRLSFYQAIEKPWDWSRAPRLADACYASHGALSIEDPMGNVWLEGEQPAEHAPRPKAARRPAREAECVAALRALVIGREMNISHGMWPEVRAALALLAA